MAFVGHYGTSIGTTQMANFIPTVYSTLCQQAYIQAAVIADRLDRRFDSLMKFGNVMHIPTMAAPAVHAKSTNTAVNYLGATEGNTEITINKDWYIAREIETIASGQINQDAMAKYMVIDGKAIANAVDNNCADLFNSLNNGTVYGTLAVDVTDDNLLACVAALDNNVVPREDRSWFISPSTFSSIMKIDKFVRLDYLDVSGETAIQRAKLNYPIYGAPVFVTASLAGTAGTNANNALLQREAIILIIQQEPRIYKQFVIDRLTDAMVTETIFGVGEARDTSGVCMHGK